MKIEFAFSMTRRQKIATTVWCGTGSALFIAPQALLPFAEVSAHTVAAGVGIPASVAVVFWLAKSLTEQHHERSRPASHGSVRRAAAEVRLAEQEHAQATRPVSVR